MAAVGSWNVNIDNEIYLGCVLELAISMLLAHLDGTDIPVLYLCGECEEDNMKG